MAQPMITIGQPAPPVQHANQGSLFKHEKQAPAMDFSNDITSLSRRVRVLEERNTGMQSRISIIEQNMVSRHKQLNTEIKTLNSEMGEMKKEISELKDRILMLVKELQMSAKKEELNILKRYIELWNPVNFVTHNEIDDIVQEVLAKKGKSKSD